MLSSLCELRSRVVTWLCVPPPNKTLEPASAAAALAAQGQRRYAASAQGSCGTQSR